MSRRFVIGLTGGIGSGKSAAADEFSRLGAAVVDTDAIAHALTASGGAAVPEVRRLFGGQAIGPDGSMDRARMRELVFSDHAAKQALEALLHPRIRDESARQIEQAKGPYVVFVVPLLVESGDYRGRVDRVLVVEASEATRIARVRARSGLSEDAVRAILRNQASSADRRAAADDVLENDGTLDALRQGVRALHEKYLQFNRT